LALALNKNLPISKLLLLLRITAYFITSVRCGYPLCLAGKNCRILFRVIK
jgi:hypothetical protein